MARILKEVLIGGVVRGAALPYHAVRPEPDFGTASLTGMLGSTSH